MEAEEDGGCKVVVTVPVIQKEGKMDAKTGEERSCTEEERKKIQKERDQVFLKTPQPISSTHPLKYLLIQVYIYNLAQI